MGTSERQFPEPMEEAFQAFDSTQTYKEKGLGTGSAMADWFDLVIAAHKSGWSWQDPIERELLDAGWEESVASKLAEEFQHHLMLLRRYDGSWTGIGYP